MLVGVLSWPEFICGLDRRRDGFAVAIGLVELIDFFLCLGTLLIALRENRGPILCTDIWPLAVDLGWIVPLEKA